MKAYIHLEDDEKVLETFNIANNLVEYNFGIYHPFHATFNSFLGYYYLIRENYSQALKYYEKGQSYCLRVLGVDHPLTSEMYLDVAKVYMKMGKLHESCVFLDKAFAIYQTKKYVHKFTYFRKPQKKRLIWQIRLLLYIMNSDSLSSLLNSLKNPTKYSLSSNKYQSTRKSLTITS